MNRGFLLFRQVLAVIVCLSPIQHLCAGEVFFADRDAASIGGTGNVNVTDHTGSLEITQTQFFAGRCGLTTTPLAVPGRPGTGVIRFETRQSDGNYGKTKGNRSELKYENQPKNSSNNVPTEIWYAWSIFIPDPGTGAGAWDGGDNAYASTKDKGNGGGREIYIQIHAPDGIDLDGNSENPPVAFYRSVDAGKPNVGYFKFTWRWNTNSSGESKSVPISIELGQWTDYVMRIVWSNSSSNNGAVQLWKNGKEVVKELATRVGYRNMTYSYFKEGIYAFDWNDNVANDEYRAVAYYDEVKIFQGTSTYNYMKPRRGTSTPNPEDTVAVPAGSSKLSIVSGAAGAEETGNPATSSYDGDSNTRWANDNTLANSWITYDLGTPKTVTALKIMLNNGLTRTFPLKIEVGDGTTFTQGWSGSTKLVAGLQTIVVSELSGRYVRVSMTAANSDGTNWFSIFETEVCGKNEAVTKTAGAAQNANASIWSFRTTPGTLHINSPLDGTFGIVLYNARGEWISNLYSGFLRKGTLKHSLSGVTAGMYVLSVRSKTGSEVFRNNITVIK